MASHDLLSVRPMDATPVNAKKFVSSAKIPASCAVFHFFLVVFVECCAHMLPCHFFPAVSKLASSA